MTSSEAGNDRSNQNNPFESPTKSWKLLKVEKKAQEIK